MTAFGLASVIIGSVIIHRYYGAVEFVQNFDVTKTPAVLLILVGFLFFLAGICGCCNLFKSDRCCLGTFFVFLFAVVVFLTVSASLGAIYRDRIDREITRELNLTMKNYTNSSTGMDKQLDDLQKHFQCCGVNSSSEWLKTPYGRTPKSCFDKDGKEFEIGCYRKVQSFFDDNFGYIVTGTLILLIVLILGMVGSCVLYRYKTTERYYTLS
uniref:Tetraspanin n=1 Tax=Romanomermis culicivorax TaxID=13658 RepID=A0A915HNR6_ROMCU